MDRASRISESTEGPPSPATPASQQVSAPATATVALTVIPEGRDVPESVWIAPDAKGDCRFTLECLQGASAIHLEVAIGGQTRLRAEVRAQPGEAVRFLLHVEPDLGLALSAGSHQILFLPLEPEYGPLPPMPVPERGTAWDICLLIDATARTAPAPSGDLGPANKGSAIGPGGRPPSPQDRPAGPPSTLDAFLLSQPKTWGAIVGPLVELVRQLGAQGSGCRLAVIAFGDEPPPQGVYASDLTPAFHLRHLPDDRPEHLLMPLVPETLADLLLKGIGPSPGADFVDASADALAAASRLQWGDETRRLLVLVGDSPGHSTAHPVPNGGDALPRRNDVDAEAARLHRDRVEILSLYHPPPAAVVEALLDAPKALVQFARDQYRRLASHPGLAFATTGFDPKQAIETLLGRETPLGRGPCWGRLVDPNSRPTREAIVSTPRL